MKGTYENMKLLLNYVHYNIHCWNICSDLEVIDHLGRQLGFNKFCCFICEWDSRAKDCQSFVK